MEEIGSLRERRRQVEALAKETRGRIGELTDGESFVELGAFDFSEGELFESENAGEGVVTGFATVGGYPFYIVAQSFEQSFGGITPANCKKIEKTLSAAERSLTPVVWLLRSQGVKLGEGAPLLEGIASLLSAAARLKSSVLQFSVICGEVYGAAAEIAALSDAVFFLPEGTLATASPFVLSAKSGKNLKREEVGGLNALRGAVLPTVSVRSLAEVRETLIRFVELSGVAVREGTDLNAPHPALNGSASAAEVRKIFEEEIELGAESYPEVKTLLCRVGGIAVAAVLFDGAWLCEGSMRKLRSFAQLADSLSLPFVTFVDCFGIEQSLAVNGSAVMKEIADYLCVLGGMEAPKVAVVTGSAVGLGYSLFAAKAAGFDYTYALAGAKISLFESEAGAQIVYAGEKGHGKEELLSRYDEEHANAIHAARGGLDNVVEPQFLAQYLVASLQMLMR